MKNLKSSIAIFLLITVLVVVGVVQAKYTSATDETVDDVSSIDSELIDTEVYPHDEVIDVNIEISESYYADLVANATDELYYLCDLTYNGYTLSNVAIRAKGNSSLRDVFLAGGDRFSFNIDLNYYVDQDLYGVDKIILNNLFEDPTMMTEYLAYESLESLGAVASRTVYTALSINGEYYGLYLSVEDVGNEFLEERYGDSLGELYKPNEGIGSDLDYVSDTFDYEGLIDTNSDDLTNEEIIDLMEAISLGEDLEEYLNIDSFLQYLAMSTFIIHLDSYQSGMFHNYYLYNNNGTFEWISWDLNMTWNGFPGVGITDSEATLFLIDEPVVGELNQYPIVEAIMDNPEYVETYHEYLQELIDNYFDDTTFETRVLGIYDLIKDYVLTDPSSFYTYTEFENALFVDGTEELSILSFTSERSDNITSQLLGVLESTNDGLGNEVSASLPNEGTQGGNDREMPGQEMTPDVEEVIEEDTSIISSLFSVESIIGIALLIGFTVFLVKKK